MFGLIRHWSAKDHKAPSWVGICIPLLFIAGGPGCGICAGHLIVATEVALDEVTLLEGVLNWIAMVMAWHLDYLVKADMVELASFLLMDLVDGCHKLAVAMPPTVLLVLYSPIVDLSLICGFGLCLALVLVEDCTDGLLARGVTCCEVKQLPRHSWFAAPELMDECFVGRAGDECFDHVYIHDVWKLVALLGKAVDVLA